MAEREATAPFGQGRRLYEIRKLRGMSQGLLAHTIGVSQGTIQNYEHGRAIMSIERIEQLAHALNVEPADLLARPGSPMPKYRYGALRHQLLRPEHQRRQNALDHLAEIWNEMRDELRSEKGIDIGDQPARDWIDAIRKRMGAVDISQQTAQQAYARIRKRLEAYHELLQRQGRSYDD